MKSAEIQLNPQLNVKLIAVLLTLVEHVRNRDRLYTENEVAYVLNVSPATVRRWRIARLISCVNFEGGVIRYRWEHIERRIEDCEVLSKTEANLRRASARNDRRHNQADVRGRDSR
jgi:helix-turn-helix protein